MQTATEQERALDQNEIAILAHDIWYKDGCQDGRDLEYWLRAEQQLRAISQQGNGQSRDTVPVERKVTSSAGKSSTSQSGPLAEQSSFNSRKRR